jgi:hypothetical protein
MRFVSFFLAATLFASCGKHAPEVPPVTPSSNDTLAVYFGTSFLHNTGSNMVYDSVSHTTVQQTTNDSLYRPDTLIVTRIGADSIRLSGSLLATNIAPPKPMDFALSNDLSYVHEFGSHSRFIFNFTNNYDSLACTYIFYSGISSAQFVQEEKYFNSRKQ